jgi:hypothetical protein
MWRDTKIAILIFNSGTGHTTVLKGAVAAATRHPALGQTLEHKSETHFRFLYAHP